MSHTCARGHNVTAMSSPLPHGSWPTPITSELVVRAAARLGEVVVDGDDIWWSESRPTEAGRSAIVRRSADGTVTDVLAAPWNARTRVHEYGGAAWTVSGGTLWFTEFGDQRLYRLDAGSSTPVAVTAEPPVPAGVRYADLRVTADGLLAVRETHPEGGGPADVVNELVRIADSGEIEVLVSGPDFVSDLRLAPDGRSLAWLQWNHPDMPWDAAQLVVRGRRRDGHGRRRRAGRVRSSSRSGPPTGPCCSCATAPTSGRCTGGGRTVEVETVLDAGCDIAGPQWIFGQSRYALLDDGRIVLTYRTGGRRPAGRALAGRGAAGVGPSLRDVPVPDCAGQRGRLPGGRTVERAGRAAGRRRQRSLTRCCARRATWAWTRAGSPAPSTSPSRRATPAPGIDVAHALVYPPANPSVTPLEGQLPPLLVVVHGGPTSAATPVLNLDVQYWTSRGFCVADVDYRGSTGYGRRYRDALRGRWGVVDLDDVVACARFLADSGRVDPARMAIRGGSAGGYTALAALTMRPGVFTAAASHYGVADLGALAAETHKFESRYLDSLVAPWPAGADVYAARSPINHTDALDTPLAVFQGEEDEVVPPDQAEAIVAALREKGVPHAYLLFPGEQHGFRKAENIRAALDGELSFYAQVWGFDLPADEGITPIDVVGAAASR